MLWVMRLKEFQPRHFFIPSQDAKPCTDTLLGFTLFNFRRHY